MQRDVALIEGVVFGPEAREVRHGSRVRVWGLWRKVKVGMGMEEGVSQKEPI